MNTSLIFQIPQLETLSELSERRLRRLLTATSFTPETYKDITSIQALLQAWENTTQSHVKTYPECQFSLFILYDTPLGFMSTISKRELTQMLSLNRISPDVKIRLRYAHGNAVSCILKTDIEPSTLLSNRTGVLVSTTHKDVLQVRIGGFTRPNNFYDRQDLDGLDVKLSSAVKHPDLHSVYIVDEDQMLMYDYPN